MNPAAHYILSKPEPFKSILLQLQLLVEHTVPEAELLYKWHLPFYYLNGKMFCFLNFRKRFVDLSFIYGNELIDQDKHFSIFCIIQNFNYTRKFHHKFLSELFPFFVITCSNIGLFNLDDLIFVSTGTKCSILWPSRGPK